MSLFAPVRVSQQSIRLEGARSSDPFMVSLKYSCFLCAVIVDLALLLREFARYNGGTSE
jgi:hypothetical protein